MGQQVLASDKIVRMNNFPLLGMVQSHEYSANMNPEEIFELGRTSKVDTAYEVATNGTLEVLSIGNTAGFIGRMTPKRSAGAFTGWAYSGNSNKNSYCFTEADLVETQFDLVVYEKPDQKTFSRSMWFPRCFLTTWTGRADSNGNATESFTWAGNFLSGLQSPFHDVISTYCTVASSSTLTVADGTATSANYTLVYVYVDERRFRNSTTADATKFSQSGTTLTVVTTEGYTIPATAIARALFFKTTAPSSTFPSIAGADRGTSAFYIKGYQVNLYIGVANADSPTAAEQWFRVQNLDYNVDLRSEELRQLAQNLEGTSIYCRVPTLPFQISVNATAYESDWADWKALMTNAHDGSSVYADIFDYTPNNIKGDPTNPIKVVMRYYTKGGTLLQDLQFLDLALDQPGERTQVQSRGEVTWAFKGTAFKLCGFNA